MKPLRTTAPAEAPERIRARIQEFLGGCREPAVFEPGEKPIPLEPGRFELQVHGSGVVLHAWSESGSLVRRILRIRGDQRGKLELAVHRLGRPPSSIQLIDLGRSGPLLGLQVERLEFRERFRRMLLREFLGWEVTEISASRAGGTSQSTPFAQAVVRQGQQAFAAIGVDESADQATGDHLLSFGLLWLDHLRSREQRRAVSGLKLFLPLKRSAATGHRLVFLNRSLATYELYEFGPDGSTVGIDENNYGNLATRLEPLAAPALPLPPVSGWIERLAACPGVEQVARPDGLISLQVGGLEFARASAGLMTYGLDEDRPVNVANFHKVERLAQEIGAARAAESADTRHQLYLRAPEKWLEAVVRSSITVVDATLRPKPVYAQVPAMAGSDRGILDLVAVDSGGRLAVVELKASEDLHLPLQGLDYWMRVKWHLDRGEFTRRGYFPGIVLEPAPPRLLLVSPAFDFHPSTETILRYFSPQVEVERVGVGAEWRRRLQVVMRARGAERPGGTE